jgi:hypothetical protein
MRFIGGSHIAEPVLDFSGFTFGALRLVAQPSPATEGRGGIPY